MKNITTKIFLAIVCFSFTSGCSGKLSSTASEVEEGIDITKDPVGVIQKVLELGKSIGNEDSPLVEKKPVEPISFQDLLEYLPESPLGWTTEKPIGETTSIGSYSISKASQTYIQDKKNVTITIFDWAFNSALYTPFLLTTEFSQESTEGYNKGIKIDDIPGREEYNYNRKDGSLNLLVNSRFLVQIDGSSVEEEELRSWWDKIDRKSLTKIASSK